MVILLLDKIDIKMKTVTKDNEGIFIITKGSIHQEYKTIIINIHASNNRVLKCMKQNLPEVKKEIVGE